MSTIPTLTDRLEAATQKAENASAIMHDVANGDAATEVPTESGPVPTINKWYADLNDRTSGAVGQVKGELLQVAEALAITTDTANSALKVSAKANAEEAAGGVIDDKYMTPAMVHAAMEATIASEQVGAVCLSVEKPTRGAWIATNEVYLQASYPVLYGMLGLQMSDGDIKPMGTETFPVSTAWRAVADDGSGNLVAVSSSITSAVARRASGGTSWTSVSVPSAQRFSVAGGNGVLIAPRSVSTTLDRSTDGGVTWQAVTLPKAATTVIFANGKFVAPLSPGAYVLVSDDDGLSFQEYALPFTAGFDSTISGGAGKFLAVNNSAPGGVAWSSDAKTWAAAASPTGAAIASCAYDGMGGFAVFSTGKAAHTKDFGATWLLTNKVPTGTANRPTFGGGMGLVAWPDGLYATLGGLKFAKVAGVAANVAPMGCVGGRFYLAPASANSSLQTVLPAAPYDTATQFKIPSAVPGRAGFLNEWMKAA